MRWRLAAALIVAVAALRLPIAAPAPQPVRFASLDGAPITAVLYLPAGQPRGTVVALHGCGGLYASSGARAGALTARHQAMAELLVAEHYAVLFPDSLTSRGESELCTQPLADRRVTDRTRRGDALAALAWAAAQPWGRPDRVALLGWSDGGTAVLAANDWGEPLVREQEFRPALAIAFYPGCRRALHDGYEPTAPLTLLLAALDDWTPARACEELGRAAGADVKVYPDSHHGFDAPGGTLRLRRDVASGAVPGAGVHTGPNPAARAQAYDHVVALLRAAFP